MLHVYNVAVYIRNNRSMLVLQIQEKGEKGHIHLF